MKELSRKQLQAIVDLFESNKEENDRYKILDQSFGSTAFVAKDKKTGNIYAIYCDYDLNDDRYELYELEVFDFKLEKSYMVEGIRVDSYW